MKCGELLNKKLYYMTELKGISDAKKWQQRPLFQCVTKENMLSLIKNCYNVNCLVVRMPDK